VGRFWRISTTATLTIAVVGGASLGPAAPAVAAPGDARARGVVVALNASVGDDQVYAGNATIGTATAPAAGGTDTSNDLEVTVPGGVGVAASGTVVQVTATRGATASSASASVVDLEVLTSLMPGTNLLTATSASAAVNCPRVGAQTADTTLTGLSLFEGPVFDLPPNTPVVREIAPVVAPPLVGASLAATVTRVETTSATGATGIALQATFTLSGTVGGVPRTVPGGSVILAEAICERPAAAPTTPPSPRPILPVTGSSDSTGILFAIGTAMIVAGAVARVTFRRRRTERASTIS
jgi:LPXTG-motif cell wall-anchored protein